MVRAFLVYLRPDWGFVAIAECQRVTHATLRITHSQMHNTLSHTHTAYHAHTNTLSMTRNGRSFRRCVAENVDNFPVFQRCGYYDCHREFLYAAIWMYVGFRDPNKEQRSWSTRSYCYCYYYYLRPCIKCTSSELSAFILRVHFQLQMEKSLRKLVHQSRLWWWMNGNEKA